MDLQRAYQGMDTAPGELETMLDGVVRGRYASDHPMTKLYRALRINLVWTVVITVGLLALLFIIPEPLILALFCVLLLFCLWAIVDGLRLLRSFDVAVSSSNSVLVEMQRQHDMIRRWMRVQERVALGVYPFSIAGGFTWGGMVGSGLDALSFLRTPAVGVVLAICILVLVPLCYYVTRWLSKLVFGRHLSALQQRIGELRS
jgi:hypothetical protein